MKKILLFATALLILAGCQTSRLDRQRNRISKQFEQLSNSGDATTEDYYNLALKHYKKHSKDSIGLEMFFEMTQNVTNPNEVLAIYDEASDIVKSNGYVASEMESVKASAKTCAGCNYIEIEGPDALETSQTLSLSAILNQGKPVIVDFWASWCPGCRKEISEQLLKVAAEGKINVLGVAVAEKSIQDTRKAMQDLGVTWPVIFGGDSSSELASSYGVNIIPTIILISPEGKIMARGYSVSEVLK